MMTPEYASPEQVKGEPVTTASDVYSLGVLLYELLAGHRPYAVKTESMEEIVRAVCRTEPPPPSAPADARAGDRAELKGDLDTIVMKALRKDPARRYASVQALWEDVRRHLEGLPVHARPDTIRYRASKFVGRHRVGVAATGLVMLTLVGGIVATARQARIAQAQRARAERRFGDVRKLANSFVFELHDAIRDLPGSTPARQLVVKKGLEYLDSLAQEASGDPVLQLELANAYEKVGDVQGSPLGANMGDTAGAIASYRKEVAIREALSAARPGDREIARDLASAYRRLGLLEDETGQTQAGVANLGRAQRLAERLVAEDGGDLRARRLLASAHDATGLLALKTGDQAGAERHQRSALAVWESEVQAAPDDVDALRGLHLTHGALARTLRITGRTAESADHYQRALAVAERRLRSRPNDPVARRDQSTGNTNLAVALYKQGDFDRATRHMTTSLALDEEMLRTDPKNSQAQRDVAWDLGFLAELASVRGKLDEALSYQRRSLAMDQARAAASPDSFQAQKDLAENLSAVSDLLSRLGRFDAAVAASRRSIARFEELQKANPGQTRLRQLMAAQYARQGSMLDALGARADACESYGRSDDLWKALADSGAAIDDEHTTRRQEVENAAARCRDVG
jgi:non-specific serine/threonine protein kinase/serine/threonine-protein kinase